MMLKNVITRKPVTAQSDWTMGRVIDLMLEQDVATLIVVDAGGRMVGLVNELPLLVAAFDPMVRNDPVSLHMQRQFVSLDVRATVAEAAEAILLHRVHYLPVLENWFPVGIISRRDVLRHVMQHQASGVSAILT